MEKRTFIANSKTAKSFQESYFGQINKHNQNSQKNFQRKFKSKWKNDCSQDKKKKAFLLFINIQIRFSKEEAQSLQLNDSKKINKGQTARIGIRANQQQKYKKLLRKIFKKCKGNFTKKAKIQRKNS